MTDWPRGMPGGGGKLSDDGAVGGVVKDLRWAGPVAGSRPIVVRKGREQGCGGRWVDG